MMYSYLLESKNQDANNEIRKYITDKYLWYFIHIYTLESGIKTVLSKTTTKIDIIGFKEKIDPKYKKYYQSLSLGAIVNNNKDKCKVLLSDYTVKGNFTIDKDLKKYTSFNSIFASSKESVNEQVLIESTVDMKSIEKWLNNEYIPKLLTFSYKAKIAKIISSFDGEDYYDSDVLDIRECDPDQILYADYSNDKITFTFLNQYTNYSSFRNIGNKLDFVFNDICKAITDKFKIDAQIDKRRKSFSIILKQASSESIKEQTLIEAANIEIAGKSDPKLISKVKKQFKEDRPDMLKDAQYKYPTSNLKLSDIRICFIDFREIDNGRKRLEYQVSIGEEDGFYDCWIDITKNKDDLGYSDYTFND